MIAATAPWWLGLLMLLLAAFVVLVWLAVIAVVVAFPVVAVRHLIWLRRERRRA